MSETSAGGSTAPRRQFLSGAVAAVAAGSLAGGAAPVTDMPTMGTAPKITALNPAGAPAVAAGYSPGVLAEGRRMVFVSGQTPADLTADMETQIRQVFQRIGEVLAAAGANFSNVVVLRTYLVHMARDLPILRKVRSEFLAEPFPAATTVGVAELAIAGLEVEIEAVAVLG